MQFQQKKVWEARNKDHPIPEEVAQALSDFWPSFQQLLYNRGIRTREQALIYLNGPQEYESSPEMLGLRELVDRLEWAIKHREKIIVYGDYDADGVTSTALMLEVLLRLGAYAQPYIPSRFDEGYGLNLEAIEALAKDGAQVVVTVDCGIRSFAEAVRAGELGLDLLISDHHHPLGAIPDAYAVVCPRQPGDVYPYKDLAGVGLAYKIAQALILRFPDSGLDADEWLDLVALGTVADVAPLTGENRWLVRRGLDQMRRSRRLGLTALIRAAGLQPSALNAFDIGFGLGPRLNAAGRLESAMGALDLLLAEDAATAGVLAQQLDNLNIRRQQMMRDMQAEADRLAEAEGSREILFAFDESFSEGILGLAASRLTDRYYRPVIVGKIDGDMARASCRSIPEFHITNALDQCKDLLERHGGHAMAAGLTLPSQNLPAFKERMSQIATLELGDQELCPKIYYDKELNLTSLVKGQRRFLSDLNSLQPTGQDNPEPVFVSSGLQVKDWRRVGKEEAHLKMTVSDGDSQVQVIGFSQGYQAASWDKKNPPRIDLIYTVGIDNYNGFSALQLRVLDLRPSER